MVYEKNPLKNYLCFLFTASIKANALLNIISNDVICFAQIKREWLTS